MHLALDDLEDADENAAVHARARETLTRFLPWLCRPLADNLVRALEALAETQIEGRARLSAELQNDALALLAYSSGRSLVAEALGAENSGGVVAALTALAPRAGVPAMDSRLDELMAQAYDPRRCTRELRRFRVELLRGFHPQTRASALAALDPERLDLALGLCEQIEDTPTLLDTFDQMRAEADVDAAKLAPGPPRHFSAVHLAFALLIIVLTAYHYLLR